MFPHGISSRAGTFLRYTNLSAACLLFVVLAIVLLLTCVSDSTCRGGLLGDMVDVIDNRRKVQVRGIAGREMCQ